MAVIKRYANRKLYDTQAGRYVTLDEIGEAIQRGEEITVLDHTSGADLTAVTLMQVIFEREKKVGGRLPRALLTGLIQTGNTAINNLRAALDANQTVENEIHRRLKVLADEGLLAVTEMQRLADLLLAERFRRAAPPADSSQVSREAVDELLRQIEALETQISHLRSNDT